MIESSSFLSCKECLPTHLNARLLSQKSLQSLFLAAFCFAQFVSVAQTSAQLFKAGTESLNKGEFYSAASYFKQALDKDDDQAAIWFSYAEACRQFHDYIGAEKGYRGCIERDIQKEYPLAKFWLGVMLQNDGSYAEAIEILNEFKTVYRKKDFYAQKVNQLIESCAWALANNKVNDGYSVIHLGDHINTTFSEINPIVKEDSLMHFASTKPAQGKTFKTQIFNVSNGEAFLPGVEAGSSKHLANGCYSYHKIYGDEFFFTQCGIENGNTRCEIFVSKFENNQWKKAKSLPVNVNLSGHTATHPNVAVDESGNQWLVFSADRPGGKGKMDIWFSKRISESEWDYPQNAGPLINSVDDEVTPFFDVHSSSLFFSSNWHYGFGGFDIFQSKVKSLGNLTFEKPKNLGLPANSPANDLYYVVTNSAAYFSSNRRGSKFVEIETCCNDIYSLSSINRYPEIPKEEVDATDSSLLQVAEKLIDVNPVQPNSQIKSNTTSELFADRQITLKDFKFPLRLYFHNDEPNPKSMSDQTDVSYIEAYQSYINLRQTYEREYVDGSLLMQKPIARQHIQSWFSDTVENCLKQLIHFSALLLRELQAGKKISVTISGYCSPLNFNEYNIRLGNRRVSSVINFFRLWNGGALSSYLNDGKLFFIQISEGEEKAPPSVSDSLNDLRSSVYSPAAARERRAEITSVKIE